MSATSTSQLSHSLDQSNIGASATQAIAARAAGTPEAVRQPAPISLREPARNAVQLHCASLGLSSGHLTPDGDFRFVAPFDPARVTAGAAKASDLRAPLNSDARQQSARLVTVSVSVPIDGAARQSGSLPEQRATEPMPRSKHDEDASLPRRAPPRESTDCPRLMGFMPNDVPSDRYDLLNLGARFREFRGISFGRVPSDTFQELARYIGFDVAASRRLSTLRLSVPVDYLPYWRQSEFIDQCLGSRLGAGTLSLFDSFENIIREGASSENGAFFSGSSGQWLSGTAWARALAMRYCDRIESGASVFPIDSLLEGCRFRSADFRHSIMDGAPIRLVAQGRSVAPATESVSLGWRHEMELAADGWSQFASYLDTNNVTANLITRIDAIGTGGTFRPRAPFSAEEPARFATVDPYTGSPMLFDICRGFCARADYYLWWSYLLWDFGDRCKSLDHRVGAEIALRMALSELSEYGTLLTLSVLGTDKFSGDVSCGSGIGQRRRYCCSRLIPYLLGHVIRSELGLPQPLYTWSDDPSDVIIGDAPDEMQDISPHGFRVIRIWVSREGGTVPTGPDSLAGMGIAGFQNPCAQQGWQRMDSAGGDCRRMSTGWEQVGETTWWGGQRHFDGDELAMVNGTHSSTTGIKHEVDLELEIPRECGSSEDGSSVALFWDGAKFLPT